MYICSSLLLYTCARCMYAPFSFFPSSRLWLKAVYKSGRRLYPPTTMYRTDERERHEGEREERRSRRASTSEGTEGRDRSRCCIRCNEATSMHCGIFRDWNLGRALRPHDSFFSPLFSFLDLSCASPPPPPFDAAFPPIFLATVYVWLVCDT